MTTINATPSNRKILRAHAREAMRNYSPIMTWLLQEDNGDLYIISEPQGQTGYMGNDEVLACTGGFYKAHGDGAACDDHGNRYKTQRAYLINLLGLNDYARIFAL